MDPPRITKPTPKVTKTSVLWDLADTAIHFKKRGSAAWAKPLNPPHRSMRLQGVLNNCQRTLHSSESEASPPPPVPPMRLTNCIYQHLPKHRAAQWRSKAGLEAMRTPMCASKCPKVPTMSPKVPLWSSQGYLQAPKSTKTLGETCGFAMCSKSPSEVFRRLFFLPRASQ